MVRSALALTVVWVVFVALFGVLPSAALFPYTTLFRSRMVPLATAAPTVTWTVKTVLSPEAIVTLREPPTTQPLAEQSAPEPIASNVVPLGSVWATLTPPLWGEGPLLFTVRV